MARVSLLLALLLVGGACSGGSTATTSAPPTTIATTTTTEAILDLRSCMVDEGIAVGDLTYDDDGGPVLNEEFLGDNDLTDPAVKDALDSCVRRLRDVGVRFRFAYGPAILQEIVDQITAYSECMRENGVDGWPDPIPDFDGSQIPFPLGAMTTSLADSDFRDANELCEPLVVFSPF